METIKNINFQFCPKFSIKKYSTLSYYYKRVFRGKEVSPGLSGKLEKEESTLILGKSAVIVAISRLNVSFKMEFLSFSR